MAQLQASHRAHPRRIHPTDIADLRACKVRELEEKRVNKEMAHIRQKFKGAAGLSRPAR